MWGRGRVHSTPVKTQTAQIRQLFIFKGVVILHQPKPEVPTSLTIFFFQFGEGIFFTSQNSKCLNLPTVFCRIWTQNLLTQNTVSLASHCITDSLCHTTYVETNKFTQRTLKWIRSMYSFILQILRLYVYCWHSSIQFSDMEKAMNWKLRR